MPPIPVLPPRKFVVSTTNVFDTLHHSALDVVYEHDEAAAVDGLGFLSGGYTQTKWVLDLCFSAYL